MFCYQCEQTDRSTTTPGCVTGPGTCGKDDTTAALQDLLIHQLKGIARYSVRLRDLGAGDDEAARFIIFGMFSTLTNVNFNPTSFARLIAEAALVRDRVRARYERAARDSGAAPEDLTGAAAFVPADGVDNLVRQARSIGILAGLDQVGPDVVGLRALNLYGMKGVCAYAHHADMLGYHSTDLFAAIERALDFLAADPSDPEVLLERALDLGRTNLEVMRLLDAAHTGTYGHPIPTKVRVTPVAGKAILVSGHDLKDLAHVLEITKDLGINVYTNGELLPAHGYPAMKAYPHLVGNYGGAWYGQQADFARFPGPIVMTSNCIIEPMPAYKQRVFTLGPVDWPGVRHLGEDLTPVIRAAQALPGFAEDGPEENITVGFARSAVLNVADQVVDAVKSGAIRHFFLIGGCDGASPARNYFTSIADQTPPDTVVMTLGCGKYRFNTHDFGEVAGLPRLMDVGQCNDAYSAVRIATALAEAFGCGVNDLPLSLVLSWFEQKAVAILLTLLAMGITNIRLGPTLPAFLTQAAVDILVERFALRPTGDPVTDLADAMTVGTQR